MSSVSALNLERRSQSRDVDEEMGIYAGAASISSLDLAVDIRDAKSKPDLEPSSVIIVPVNEVRRSSLSPEGAGVAATVTMSIAGAGIGMATSSAPGEGASGEGVHVHTYHPAWQTQLQTMRHKLEPISESLPKKLRQFYKSQYQLLQDFEDSSRLVAGGHASPTAEAQEEEKVGKKSLVTLAIRLSLGVNICLLIVKAVVAVQSGSLSILASAFDSSLDLLSGIIVALTERAITKRDPMKYPQGKTRLEPLGLVVLSSLMTMVSVNVAVEGIRRIADGPEANNLGTMDLILLAIVVTAKLLLFLFCRRQRGSASAQALALDHRNDVFTNLFGALSAYLGATIWPYLDPIGAILFSLFVIYTWCGNALENMRVIVGHSAPQQFLQQLTFLAMHHDDRILQVDTVRAFHFGINYLVEVDIVLPEDMPLRLTHDIGEALQVKLEMLPEVDRAFVHIDYETTHKPEHKVV